MLIVVGDALLDRDLDGRATRLAPDAPVPVVDAIEPRVRPGGAALAAFLAGDRLVCALGRDRAGAELRRLLRGVELLDLGLDGSTPEKVRVRAGGVPVVRLDYGGSAGTCGPLPAGAFNGAGAVLVSDYGRGVAAATDVRAALSCTPFIWDPHPRGPEPVPGALLVTPNLSEATAAAGTDVAEDAARILRERWHATAVCVTMGARGALLVCGEGPAVEIPAPPVTGGDPCGAGDCFASTAAARLAAGDRLADAVATAVQAASAFVAAGGAAAANRPSTTGGALPEPPARAARATGNGAPPRAQSVPARRFVRSAPESAVQLAARVRREGGTVVATGGCFDLLHAGHVRMLEEARTHGDCLIVCLNSDTSVSRLKGSDRPLVEQDDRAAVLQGLACVDAVAIFEEDDPRAVLGELRPHVWVKGGDYAVDELPEARTLAGWGGRAVIVAYVAGRSTTRLITEVLARAR